MANQKIVLKLKVGAQDSGNSIRSGQFHAAPDTVMVWNYSRIIWTIVFAILIISGIFLSLNEADIPSTADEATGYSQSQIAVNSHSPEQLPQQRMSDTTLAQNETRVDSFDETPESEEKVDSVKVRESLPISTSDDLKDLSAQKELRPSEATLEKDAEKKTLSKKTIGDGDVRDDGVSSLVSHESADLDVHADQLRVQPELHQQLPILSNDSTSSDQPLTEPTGAGPNVARSLLARNVINREPIHPLDSNQLRAESGKAIQVCFFTELVDLAGQTVTHRWTLNGNEVFSKRFAVRGQRWRVYTSKLVNKTHVGNWVVDLLDSSGDVMDTHRFELLSPL